MTGTVVLDHKRMNRVIAVDDKRHFANDEPGVSYFDLYRHNRGNKLKVWIDCPDPGWGGVMGRGGVGGGVRPQGGERRLPLLERRGQQEEDASQERRHHVSMRFATRCLPRHHYPLLPPRALLRDRDLLLSGLRGC